MRNTKPSSRSTQARRNNAQMYNRTSNLLKNNTQSSTKRNENTENKPKSNSTKQKPKTLNREIKIENKEEISIEKTNDILNQINQYLDEEKKKLN